MTYGTGGSYPHPFECSQDNSISSLPVCPATPCHPRFPPLLPSSSLSLQHVSCLMAPRCALAKIYFYRPPFQFNPIHFARLSISQAACFFFKILIFGHKCGGLAIVHGFGFPIRQQRHFHQDQAKLPRRFWPLALWPIGLCYGWAKARHQKKIYMPSRKSGSQNILMYDSSQETKRYEN